MQDNDTVHPLLKRQEALKDKLRAVHLKAIKRGAVEDKKKQIIGELVLSSVNAGNETMKAVIGQLIRKRLPLHDQALFKEILSDEC